MSQLKTYLQLYFDISDSHAEMISQFFRKEKFAKNEFFLRRGQICHRMGFIETGIVREFLIDETGREITKWISTQGYFVMDIASFYFQAPARFDIQILEETEMHVISRKDYEKLKDLLPEWPNYEKLFVAKCFAAMENRIVNQISLSAEERYLQLFEQRKELFHLVPLQYLASMIGMTPETFSRIRKKLTSTIS